MVALHTGIFAIITKKNAGIANNKLDNFELLNQTI